MASNTDHLRRVTLGHHARAIALLPAMNTLVIPMAILILTHDFDSSPIAIASLQSLVGLAGLSALAIGLGLVARSIAAFVRRGHGTLAPWDPTQVLVTDDVYGYCRNPMKLGLFLILIGESLALRSYALATWCTLFMIVNVVYIRVSEEPGLRERFGAEYDNYCNRVPRWWPRISRHAKASAHGSSPQ